MNIRHGDMALIGVKVLPDCLVASGGKTLMVGIGGNNHDVDDGVFYKSEKDGFVFGYLVAGDNCQLLHPDHGVGSGYNKLTPVPSGVYELRKQFEITHQSMLPVVD